MKEGSSVGLRPAHVKDYTTARTRSGKCLWKFYQCCVEWSRHGDYVAFLCVCVCGLLSSLLFTLRKAFRFSMGQFPS